MPAAAITIAAVVRYRPLSARWMSRAQSTVFAGHRGAPVAAVSGADPWPCSPLTDELVSDPALESRLPIAPGCPPIDTSRACVAADILIGTPDHNFRTFRTVSQNVSISRV